MTENNEQNGRTITRTVTATGVVTREVDDEDTEMLRVPISSTRPDREGDRFTKEALEGMADQIRSEQPMVFDNHGIAGGFMEAIPYDSRETIGAQMDAEVEEADDGESDLYAYVNPDGTHTEGERMLRQVRDEGQPIKFSVGFRVRDADSIEDDAGNEVGREFKEVDQLETSRVGIPANPDASAGRSVAKDGVADLPGYQNHPIVQMMAGADEAPAPEAGGDVVSKAAAPDGGDPEPETDPGKESGADVIEIDGRTYVAADAQSKGFEDVGMSEFDAFVAAHQEGADADEVGAALDEVGEWVGQLNRDETAALVSEAADVPTDEVEEQFEEWLDGEEEEEADSVEELSDLPEETREEIEEMRAEREQFRKELSELKDGGIERGDPETGPTDMTPPETDDAGGDDDGPDGTDTETNDADDRDDGATVDWDI